MNLRQHIRLTLVIVVIIQNPFGQNLSSVQEKMHRNKATRKDGLYEQMFKATVDIVLLYLELLFIRILDSGQFPPRVE